MTPQQKQIRAALAAARTTRQPQQLGPLTLTAYRLRTFRNIIWGYSATSAYPVEHNAAGAITFAGQTSASDVSGAIDAIERLLATIAKRES
jgi:hypothetical protein